MADNEELFTHTVGIWTAGQLREALGGVPDELPVHVWIADEPGGETCDEQVVYDAGPWNSHGNEIAPPDQFGISCEFPPGEYYRRTR